ncbi:hypothetical protein [Micromonospora echinospora]|uniref:hypothetical protein n=1 Tax=Micromonospora echinospora TaxID=1877 RepID=UPI003A874673
MALDTPQVLRRLAFTRYLHQIGTDQSRLPEPLCSAAVLMFHDAVEGFLLMVGEHLESPSIREFEKYWQALAPDKLPGGVRLPNQQSMTRLNKARVALKHHGVHPSRESIEQAAKDTAAFLAAASRLVFDVDLEAVSMSSVIPQDKVRELAEAADNAAGAGDRVTAMVRLADAWMELFEPWPTTRVTDDESPFRFGPNPYVHLQKYDIAAYLYSEKGSRRNPRGNEDIAEQLATVTDIASKLQSAARLTVLGLDFAEYQKFKALTPYVSRSADGRREYRAPVGYAPSSDDVAFCLQFVVTAALRLVEVEARLMDPPWLEGQNRWHMQWVTIATSSAVDD